jgi:hypothetical protein
MGCVGVIGLAHDHPLMERLAPLVEGHTVPIIGGRLHIFPSERYLAHLAAIIELIRSEQAGRYILTVGSFNDPERPLFYDMYSRFALESARPAGETLLCTETYTHAMGDFKLSASADFHPLCLATPSGLLLVATAFGQLEASTLWYGTRSSDYVSPHEQFAAMTRRSEMPFWYSKEGFIYLANQAELIRAYRTRSRRIVVYSLQDIKDPQFIKLLFTFEELGIEVVSVYEEDLLAFNQDNGIGAIEVFARAGQNSFVLIDGEPYFSDDRDIADHIALAQEDLLGRPGIYRGIDEFMTAFRQLIVNVDRRHWSERARRARILFEDFSSYPRDVRAGIADSFAERWRRV